MRWLAQGLFSKYPLLGVGAVALRWVSWFALGHLPGVVVTVAARALGLGVVPSIAVGIVGDVAVSIVAHLSTGGPAVALRRWLRLTRFRRRWPHLAREIGLVSQRPVPVVFPGNYLTAPGGLRPLLAAPRLAWVPRSATERSISWYITVVDGGRFDDLRRSVERIPQFERRIERAELSAGFGGFDRWTLTIFYVETPNHMSPPLLDDRDISDVPGPGPSVNGAAQLEPPSGHSPFVPGSSDASNGAGEPGNKSPDPSIGRPPNHPEGCRYD